MKRNQDGFSFIHSLLLVLVIAVMGGVGYVVYSASRPTEKSQSTTKVVSTVQPGDWQETKTDFDFTVKLPEGWSLGSSGKDTYNGVGSKTVAIVQGKDDEQFSSDAFGMGSLKLKDTSETAFENYLASLQANAIKTYQSLGYGNSSANTSVVRTKLQINGKSWQQTDLITPTLFSRTLYLWHGDHADTLIVDTENQAKAAQLSTSYLYPMAASVSLNRQ